MREILHCDIGWYFELLIISCRFLRTSLYRTLQNLLMRHQDSIIVGDLSNTFFRIFEIFLTIPWKLLISYLLSSCVTSCWIPRLPILNVSRSNSFTLRKFKSSSYEISSSIWCMTCLTSEFLLMCNFTFFIDLYTAKFSLKLSLIWTYPFFSLVWDPHNDILRVLENRIKRPSLISRFLPHMTIVIIMRSLSRDVEENTLPGDDTSVSLPADATWLSCTWKVIRRILSCGITGAFWLQS